MAPLHPECSLRTFAWLTFVSKDTFPLLINSLDLHKDHNPVYDQVHKDTNVL